MGWLSILTTLVSLASTLVSYIADKQLVSAGEAKAIAKQLEKANAIIKKAQLARRNARRKFDSNNGVPSDTDPHLRD